MTVEKLADVRSFVDLFNRDGSRAARLCCEIILYLNDEALLNPKGLLAVHDRAFSLVGNSIKFVQNGDGAPWEARPNDVSSLLQGWFARGGPSKGSYCLYMESGEVTEEPSDRGIHFSWVLGDGYIRILLPAEVGLETPEQLCSLALEFASLLDFRWGSAGFTMNVQRGYDGSYENSALAKIGQRLSGVDLGDPLYWSILSKKCCGIKGVNWLTFLGSELVSKVATSHQGQGTFLSALGNNVTLSDLPHGVMIQAGAVPGFGDTTQSETLPEYRQVARALRVLKIPPDVLRNFDEIGGTVNTRIWLNRFDYD
jgi:hypothetical protein